MTNHDLILLGHGGGGQLTHRLISECIAPALKNPILDQMDDAACIPSPGRHLVFTTDSFVVDPLFFPGGDIGTLAACGTLNDIAMQGAKPLYLTLGLILEEGFPVADLKRIVQSLADAAKSIGVLVVAGDTKVVERGKGGGVYINTSGLGVRKAGVSPHVSNAKPGDAVIVTGTIGDHGMAVMSKRQGLEFETALESDVAVLWPMIEPLLKKLGPSLHVLRDPTRGGVTAALCDIAEAAKCGVRIRQRAIPVTPAVKGACGLLGLDPLNVANEGKAMVVCAPEAVAKALAILRQTPLGKNAVCIGTITDQHPGAVVLETEIGGERRLTMPAGEELPRIC